MTTAQTEYLTNGDFGAPGTGPTTNTKVGPGNSAAPHWGTWNNTGGITTTTELVPSTLPHHSHMLHVNTTGPNCGVAQVYDPRGQTSARFVVSLFVLRGRVGIGIGHGGSTSTTTFSTTTGHWEQLEADHQHETAGEVVIYGEWGDGASYYIGNASVT
jgi:hypothetical protein